MEAKLESTVSEKFWARDKCSDSLVEEQDRNASSHLS